LLAALDRFHRCDEQVVIAAADWNAASSLRTVFHGSYRPHTTLSWLVGKAPDAGPVASLNAGKGTLDGQPTVYVCKEYRCKSPAVGDDAIRLLMANQVIASDDPE